MDRKQRLYNRNVYATFGESSPYKQAGFAFSATPFASFVVSILFLFTLAFLGLGEDFTNSDVYKYAVFLLPQLSTAIVLGVCLFWTKRTAKELVKSQNCHFKYYIWAIVLQIGLFTLSWLNGVFLSLLGEVGYESPEIQLPSLNGFGIVGVLFVIAVLPAVFEEILFRGVLFNGLKCFGRVGSVLLCGALFSLFHQNPAQTPYQFLCGVAYALVALKSGSVLPTIVAHFFNNALIIVLTYALGADWQPTGLILKVVFILSFVCLIAATSYFLKKEKTENPMPKNKQNQKEFWRYAVIGIVFCAVSWLSVFFTGL